MSETKEDCSKTLSLRKNEIDVFSDFEPNKVINIEILRHSVYKCLYSTEDDYTFQSFISKFDEDRIATIHFKKSMIFEKYFSICTNHQVLLIPTSSSDQINKVLTKIQKCEIYCIEDKDRDRLSKYENSKLLQNFASNEKLKELYETLSSRINERFEIFNGVQSVMVCNTTTYLTFFYLIEEVVSIYYDLSPQPLDFPSETDSSTIDDKANAPTVIPFYYEEKGNENREEGKSQESESSESPPQPIHNNTRSNLTPVFMPNYDSPNENKKQQKDFNKVFSLRKNEIDVFSDFEQNTVISIEILRHSVYKCLYSTEDDNTFQSFISKFDEDRIATIHFKKSMIFEKYFSICTNHQVLLIPTSSSDQINKVLTKIQKCEIYCIEDKDRDRLSKYENSKLLQNFASNEKLEDLRLTHSSRLNERFEVFNSVQSVMVCYRTTYMTFIYLIEDAVSSYYDLSPRPLDFPSDPQSSNDPSISNPTVIPFYYEDKNDHKELSRSSSHSNSNLNQNSKLSKVPSLPKNEIDIFRDFQENEIMDIEILPNAIFRCLYSTENDSTFHSFISEIKEDQYATVHFKKSMLFDKYFNVCTDHHVLLIPYEAKDQINELLSQIQNNKIFCISEKDRDKLNNFDNQKLLKSFATTEDLSILRETLHSRISERFGVFNAAQSVMVCYRTTYMTFFYLTEEVLSTYYDLSTKPHKYLKTAKNVKSYRSNPIKSEDLPKFNELYQSLESKIKVLHKSINGNDKYVGLNSTLIDISDLLQISSNHQKKKELTDCIQTYQKVNNMMKEAEDSINNFINQSETATSSQKRSPLPSLNQKTTTNLRTKNEKQRDQDQVEPSIEIADEIELKKLKKDVETLQGNINHVDQQIKQARSNELSPSKSVNSPSRRRNQPNQPLQPTSPISTRNASTSSPRTMKNRLRLMQKRVDEGDIMAMYSLGACYALGDGVPEDKEKALYYYTLAAEKGNKNAQYAAAACHSYGKGTKVDKNKAFELYLQAAQQGHPKAQFAVAHFYEYGQGGAGKNHKTAKEWYKKAAEQGHSAAKKFLDDCLSEAPVLDVEE